ncbi:Panacea domain-containing protein [Mesorhizobium sp. M0018]|uniref:Panacea domain-containing protein n=1 Tax=Mesorhizobium sp. M0018 TaxID=2956844 RepID=UPI00333DB1BC
MERSGMLMPGYDVVKAAQAAAFFALKSGGKINVLKLAKLLYLAERGFMSRYDEPMFYDHLVSMPDGPVTSITLNLINGDAEDDTWPKFVAPRQGYDVSVADGVTLANLENLSAAEMELLGELWEKFKTFDRYRLRDWTHQKKNVPEWEDPKGSSCQITHEEVFEYLGKPDVKALVDNIRDRRHLAKAIRQIV